MIGSDMLLLLAEGAGVAAEGGMEPSMGATLLQTLAFPVLIFVVFYFLLIRPQRKKDKKAKEMLKQLKVGDRVCTIGGIYGTIDSIKDDVLTLAIGVEKTKLMFARWAIRNVEEISISNDAETLV